MKIKNWTNEFKVGLFVVVCLFGLFYMTYSTGKLDIKKKGYYVFVIFKETAGLGKKAPVMLNGLEVGKVEEVKPFYDSNKTLISLKLWLEEDAKIREDSKFSIQMMGLMGEKYVQITSSENEKFVAPESTLSGDPYIDLSALITNLNKVVEENKEALKGAIANFDKVLANANDVVAGNKDSLARTIKNFETTSQNFEEFSDDLKRNPWKLLFRAKEKHRVSKEVHVVEAMPEAAQEVSPETAPETTVAQ
jgi:phospholipid/cholesterol/gamma-HCH transport system substrate-binding protein